MNMCLKIYTSLSSGTEIEGPVTPELVEPWSPCQIMGTNFQHHSNSTRCSRVMGSNAENNKGCPALYLRGVTFPDTMFMNNMALVLYLLYALKRITCFCYTLSRNLFSHSPLHWFPLFSFDKIIGYRCWFFYSIGLHFTSCLFCPSTGSIGFFSTFFFIRKIYSVVKVD